MELAYVNRNYCKSGRFNYEMRIRPRCISLAGGRFLWEGPPYLQNSKEQWSIETIDYNDAIENNVEEIKLSTITMITKVITGIEINQLIKIENYSDFT